MVEEGSWEESVASCDSEAAALGEPDTEALERLIHVLDSNRSKARKALVAELDRPAFRQMLADVGFGDIEIQVTREYDPRELAASAREGNSCCAGSAAVAPPAWDGSAWDRFERSGGKLVSAFVRATKPVQE